jgi:hypothetical protein
MRSGAGLFLAGMAKSFIPFAWENEFFFHIQHGLSYMS